MSIVTFSNFINWTISKRIALMEHYVRYKDDGPSTLKANKSKMGTVLVVCH